MWGDDVMKVESAGKINDGNSNAKRAIMIVLDSVGAGEAPDAAAYGDVGSNTLGNIAAACELKVPNMAKLGLGNILPLNGVAPEAELVGAFGKMQERACGKDTTAGHWEIAGTPLLQPLPVYPEGFPPEVIEEFCRLIGRGILGNEVASGTEIIQRLGEEHMKTGRPIVYTSADSVFQIAAHEAVIPPEELYGMCRTAWRLLTGKHGVGRVIARPFEGEAGSFRRTERRRDFSLLPPEGNVFDILSAAGVDTVAIGKINDIFAGRNIAAAYPTHNNAEGEAALLRALDEHPGGFIWANLVDFDMLYGHRNDVSGYAAALMDFDRFLPQLLAKLTDNDLLIITADHGNDPTTPSTDHSREYVPLLVYGAAASGVRLGVRESFADAGATVTEWLGVKSPAYGKSFLSEILA